MDWTINIPQADFERLQAKAKNDETSIDEMLAIVLRRYFDDVAREAGASIDASLAVKLAAMTDEEKQALAATIGA